MHLCIIIRRESLETFKQKWSRPEGESDLSLLQLDTESSASPHPAFCMQARIRHIKEQVICKQEFETDY